MKKRVLFVDNDPDFLDTRSEHLEKAGFELFKATSFEKAEQILGDHWIHLAIIDIRLRDDNDDKDTSGLMLAKQKAYRSVPKIILTRFPSYEYVREALGPALDGLPPAVEFLAKQEGAAAMMQAVEKAFAKYVRINQNLTIRYGSDLSFFHLAHLIEPEIDSTRIPDRGDELEDLFRRLFYDSRQVTISRTLAWRKKGVLLAVSAFSEEGTESQFVVACGPREHIQAEEERYETFVPQAMGEWGTLRVNSEETIHFAATAYTLTKADLVETVTLSELYRDSSVELVTAALTHLFDTTLAPWYERGRYREEERTLNELCLARPGLSSEVFSHVELGRQMDGICREALAAGLAQIDYSPHKLTFHRAAGSSLFYPNPISCLSERRLVFEPPVLCGTTYGQLNGNSVLANRQGRTWLIDFTQVSQGPLVHDFVSLETAIKFDLLAVSNVQARYEMERRLLAVSHLDEEADFEGLEAEVQKALQAISLIRHRASTVVDGDMGTYLGGLLFCAAGQLAAYEPEVRHTRYELIPYLHALLSAAMLCQKLLPLPQEGLPSQAVHSLWIDEPNKKVWVEGRPVSLSPQEFDLLLYLYHHPGRLCSRMAIAEQVFGAAYEADVSDAEKRRLEEGRLNSTMSRLRKKVEPNPSHPKYIIAVRGEGYRLELES
jgi:DNA-binding response OmpR family regulator